MVVSSYYPVMEEVAQLIAELDVLVSFATASSTVSNQTWVRPHLVEKGDLRLIDSRHPLIEALDASRCIANDCEMIKGKSNLQIITGPNMGGKSTYIR